METLCGASSEFSFWFRYSIISIYYADPLSIWMVFDIISSKNGIVRSITYCNFKCENKYYCETLLNVEINFRFFKISMWLTKDEKLIM